MTVTLLDVVPLVTGALSGSCRDCGWQLPDRLVVGRPAKDPLADYLELHGGVAAVHAAGLRHAVVIAYEDHHPAWTGRAQLVVRPHLGEDDG